MPISKDYVQQAQTALQKVAEEFRPKLIEASGQIQHTLKSDDSPVTELDLAVETAIKETLKTIDLNVGFEGEEHGKEGNTETFWLIDPIDGTEQFVRGLPAYRMMCTLVVDHKLEYAFVYDVAKDELYTAENGKGAFCNGKKLEVSQRPMKRAWVEFTAGLELPEVVALVSPLRKATRGIRITGDFTYTPKGIFDAHVYYKAHGSSWDWTPWALIIKEAGGKVANIGKPDYDYRDQDFVAANPVIFDELKQLIDRMVKQNS